jgi:hypothetical protein
MSFEYDSWIKALSEIRVVDHVKQTVTMNPEKVREVTLTVPAWAAASMDHRCSSCGWPVYIINVGSNQRQSCTNPECFNSPIFRSISSDLQHQDRMKWKRRERAKARKIEREKKVEEKERLKQLIRDEIRIVFAEDYAWIPKKRRSVKD